jgi:hypothetical protein
MPLRSGYASSNAPPPNTALETIDHQRGVLLL